MEMKIVISDSPGGAGASVQLNAPSTGESHGATRSAPADLLSRAAASGAIDAGPAPDLSAAGETGAPLAHISSTAEVVASGPGESAGAAPGSGAYMETSTAPAGGVE